MAGNGTIYSTKGVKLLTPVFRISFPKVFVAEAMEEGQKKKFGFQAVWKPADFTPKDKILWKKLLAEMDVCSKGLFKKAWKDLPGAAYKKGIRNGNEKDELEGYGEGTRFATLSSAKRPGVIDRDGEPIGPEHDNEELIYPGAFCQATVGVFAYNNVGKGVSISLRNLRKIKDGKRLDNTVAATEDFDEDVDSDWLDMEDDADIDEGGEDEDFD